MVHYITLGLLGFWTMCLLSHIEERANLGNGSIPILMYNGGEAHTEMGLKEGTILIHRCSG